jgi:hypothetical protein
MGKVWLVLWSYSRDREVVIDSVWADAQEAIDHAKTVRSPRTAYVEEFYVRRAPPPNNCRLHDDCALADVVMVQARGEKATHCHDPNCSGTHLKQTT